MRAEPGIGAGGLPAEREGGSGRESGESDGKRRAQKTKSLGHGGTITPPHGPRKRQSGATPNARHAGAAPETDGTRAKPA